MEKITVIGSSSMDLVVSAQKRPEKGKTIIGESFKTMPGGKGANQAVAASRLGGDVTMVGCVGEDAFGKEIIENFSSNQVATNFVETIAGVESGTAHITLAEGDTFNAAFAIALAEGKSIDDSLWFANRAASLSVTGFGAQSGMPTREEVEGSL